MENLIIRFYSFLFELPARLQLLNEFICAPKCEEKASNDVSFFFKVGKCTFYEQDTVFVEPSILFIGFLFLHF